MLCEYCHKPKYHRNQYRKRKIEHINITQNPQKHKFCSKTCKDKWINEQRNQKQKPLQIN